MPEYRLGEEQIELWNPLPGVIDKDVTKAARISRRDTGKPEFTKRISLGMPPMKIELLPGQKIPMPISVGQYLYEHHSESGVAILRATDDPNAVAEEALTRAIEFYRQRGTMSLLTLKSGHRWTAEEAEAVRQEFAGQHINVERERLLREELLRLQTAAVPVPPTPEKTEVEVEKMWEYEPKRKK